MNQQKQNEEYSAFVQEMFNFYSEIYPVLSMIKGLNLKKIQPISYEDNLVVINRFKQYLQKLNTFKDEQLSESQKNSKRLILFLLNSKIDSFNHFWIQFPLSPYSGSEILNFNSFSEFQFRNENDLDDYLNLLDDLGKKLHDMLIFTKKQLEKDIFIPKPELKLIIPMWKSFASPIEKNLLMVSETRLKSFNDVKVREFVNSCKNKIETVILPRMNEIISFIQGDYWEQAPDTIGLWQYPGGKAAYLNLIKNNISYSWSPEEIHQLGLDEIDRLNHRIEAIMEKNGIEGDVNTIYRKITTDPQYSGQNPSKIKARLEAFLKEVQDKLIPRVFKKFPKTPGIIKRLPPNLEGSLTFGEYEPPLGGRNEGIYYYNASNVGAKEFLQIPAIALHELYPGHHFQISLTLENDNLDPFQKVPLDNSYLEGWAEYASNLGYEFGVISNPMDQIGGLFGRKMFAIRLVVDTGLNYFGWSLEKAKKFMKENHFGDDSTIHTECLRYACDMPAQALAYRIGFLQIHKFRETIKAQLEEKFDIKEFHEAVLEFGALPLSILEEHLKEKLLGQIIL